jgi:hypothetical protein
MRRNIKQSQHWRIFTSGNRKTTFDLTQVTEKAEPISSDELS